MLHSANPASVAFIAALLAPLLSITPAFAAVFTGNSNGTFGKPAIDPVAEPNATFSIEKSSSQGSLQGETFVSGKPGTGSMPNRLSFTGSPFTALPNRPFAAGSLFYLNGQTFRGTNVSSVPLSINLSFDQPAQAQNQFEYSIDFDLTTNRDPAGSADNLIISDDPAAQTFQFEEATYLVELLGFSQDNGNAFTRNFQVLEDQVIDSTLFAQVKLASIDPVPELPTAELPEPATVTGLLALGATTLLKRKNG
ncbi:MAG: choice-of-anchor K domain-containing protein [Phormidesmis sp.]